MDEAVRTVVRGVGYEAGLEWAELPTELTRLAEYSADSRVEHLMCGIVDKADQQVEAFACRQGQISEEPAIAGIAGMSMTPASTS
jgi:hypothetical protein